MASACLNRALPAGLAIVALAFSAACSTTGGFFGSGRSGAADFDAAGLAVYLDMMQRLVEGDAPGRAEAFNEAQDAAEAAPTPTNRLRYALALSVPGHPGSDAHAAAERLRALIAADDTFSAEERMLATLQLRQVEDFLILEEQNESLRRQQSAALEAKDSENAERLAALQTENQRLRTELENTTKMLEAITNIEQSISEREGNEQ